MRHGIVPPYLLAQLSALQAERMTVARSAAAATLAHDAEIRSARSARAGEPAPPTAPGTRAGTAGARADADTAPAGPQRTIGDAGGTEQTPGTVVRREGEDPTSDVAVDEAYEGLGAIYALYAEVYGRDSIDGAGLALNATVHYGKKYDNAFWDGSQMVFGDGDGEVFNRFTASLSVIGHELAHGITQYTAGLVYQGQSGALNESVSDVFGALVEQYKEGQTADRATWLIGAGLFTDEVQGAALRSMIAPGTAYDDDVLGKDPQPDHMDSYIKTSSDNGGVHLNSGIPNRAFAVAARELGGNAWETVGRVWYDTLTNGSLTPTVRFAGFATATTKAARARFGVRSPEELAVRKGWDTVGLAVKGLPLTRRR
ncbi:M4 family metallopeptidase [Nakamurella deserti]|uniref:M4 family metallopeptidase n=1 Tax=Nakamurella deserti TaxID=2164074 RepID=UPI000DBE6413|nr:M4 family metallopeptidase [Nakamurella deserti]